MLPTFQSKIWKAAALSSYLGMHMAVILVTVVVPLAFVVMGVGNVEDIALHSASMKMISYWLIGMGGISLLVSTLGVLASLKHNKTFSSIVTVLAMINVLLAVILLIWGLIPSEPRKSYLRDAWDEMDPKTKEVIQNHFSCCGFEYLNDTTVNGCYADETLKVYWPNDCYTRMMSSSLPAPSVEYPDGSTKIVGSWKSNAFLIGFLTSFLFLIIIQTATTSLFLYGLIKWMTPQGDNAPEAETYENVNGIEMNGGLATNGSVSIGSTKKVKSVSDNVDSVYFTPDMVTDSADNELQGNKSWFQKIPDAISTTLESAFYWLGVRVGQHPKMTILLSLLLTASISMGLLQREDQPSGSRGFLSDDSLILQEYIAYRRVFYLEPRDQYIIVADSSNILTENKVKSMLAIDENVRKITGDHGNFTEICLPVAGACKERSLFEFWSYNSTAIDQLTNEEILQKLNENLTSPIFRDEVDITTILGGISRASDDNITGARAHLFHYVTSRADDNWELQFIDIGNSEYSDFNVYVSARNSARFESRSYTRELPLLFGGFGLIFIYIIIMTGKFSLLEHRAYIALLGVATAGLSMASGIGLSASLGFKWSVLHMVVPFLVIGIGVDDMFILIQAWNTVQDNSRLSNRSLEERSGHVLKTAGVSITVTSVTDLVAFAVGASSDLGSFASFSVYVAICIILLFFLQCTFFLACTVLDQRRREERYDACLACCYKHDENYRPSRCSEREFFHTFFEDIWGRFVQFLPVQIIAILVTLGVTGLMMWGFIKLPVSFDPDWYLPQDSYLIDFNDQYDKYYSAGQPAHACVVQSDFYLEREKLHHLYEKLKTNSGLDPKYLSSWFENYMYWMKTDRNITNVFDDVFTDAKHFYRTVFEFLQTKGKFFAGDVVMDRSGVIIGSKFQIRHVIVADGVDNVDIVDSVHDDCESIGFSGMAFPMHRRYFNYAIMKIIRKEVYRNLGITLLCVFIVVLPMIASIQMSFWVVLCVVFTIIDVAGSMYFAGLTIETSTIITLLLSVGLAVDYAAHVAHKFLTLKGTRRMRVRVTLGQIGPAVFNGGFSTFLALVLLSGSDTYSYKVFFTVFACVVGYGLWNGLIFLPCVLGLLGPAPHITAEEATLSQRHHIRKNKIQSKENLDGIQGNNMERT